jgi:hypothetical protein
MAGRPQTCAVPEKKKAGNGFRHRSTFEGGGYSSDPDILSWAMQHPIRTVA